MSPVKAEWHCIVNPKAGSGKTMVGWAVCEKALNAASVPFVTVLTERKFHARELACSAAEAGYRRFLAVGGDGSVHDVLCGIMDYVSASGAQASDFVLGVVPIGSGNDWIKSLGVPHDIPKVVSLVTSESFTMEDIVKVETKDGVSYMANIGGVGFDSHVCERVNALKEQGKRGRFIYLTSLIYTLFHTKKFHARVVADGEEVFEGDLLSAAFGNGPYCGGGMKQVPDAVIDDGLLDYMLVPKAPVIKILLDLPRLYNDTLHESKLLKAGKCRVLEMCGENIAEVDGEVVGALPLKITMTGQQIRVVAPR